MTINRLLLLVLLIPIFFIIKYFIGISGQVIDSHTGKPIEGAVVFVEWSKSKELPVPGLPNSQETYKVAEVITNKRGDFYTRGALDPFVSSPTILIYKKGYIACNNEYIFPNWEKRINNGPVFRLDNFEPKYTLLQSIDIKSLTIPISHEQGIKLYRWEGPHPFKPDYTYSSHIDFIEIFIWRSGNKIKRAIEWEENKAREEEKTLIMVNISGRVVDTETNEPIKGALVKVEGKGRGYMAAEKWESFSDNEGKVNVFAILPLLENPPSISVNKAGYFIWRSSDKDASIPPKDNLENDFIYFLRRCKEQEIYLDNCYK